MIVFRKFKNDLFPNRYPFVILIAFLITALQIIFLIWRFSSWYYDDPFITYRYAWNLDHGFGFVYNPGEKILSTTTPLFALVLSGFGYSGFDVPRIATLIGCVSSGLCGLIFWDLSRQWKMNTAGWVGLLLIPTFPLVASTIGSETPLYIALILGTVDCFVRRNYPWTAVFNALLILVRPDGAILTLVLALYFLFRKDRRIPWGAVGIFIGLISLWFGFAWAYFGSPLPVTLMTKQQQGVMAISQLFAPGAIKIATPYLHQWYFVVEALLALLGIIWLLKNRPSALMLLIWTIFYFIAYTLLGVTRYFWYYAPLIPGFIVMVGAGFQALFDGIKQIKWTRFDVHLIKRLTFAGLAITWIGQGFNSYNTSKLPDSRYTIYRAVGEWININTGPNEKVGALEVGIIGFYAKRYIIDFAGLIQPEVARQMNVDFTYQDTALWSINNYHPSYLVLNPVLFPGLLDTYVNKQCVNVQEFNAEAYNSSQEMIIYSCK